MRRRCCSRAHAPDRDPRGTASHLGLRPLGQARRAAPRRRAAAAPALPRRDGLGALGRGRPASRRCATSGRLKRRQADARLARPATARRTSGVTPAYVCRMRASAAGFGARASHPKPAPRQSGRGGRVESPDGLERSPLLADQDAQLGRTCDAGSDLRAPSRCQRVVGEGRKLGLADLSVPVDHARPGRLRTARLLPVVLTSAAKRRGKNCSGRRP